jgi:hypothetical protein
MLKRAAGSSWAVHGARNDLKRSSRGCSREFVMDVGTLSSVCFSGVEYLQWKRPYCCPAGGKKGIAKGITNRKVNGRGRHV